MGSVGAQSPDVGAKPAGVGSPAVQVYYDVANATTKGYDIYQEIRTLGRGLRCRVTRAQYQNDQDNRHTG